jgi:1-acyl-sn-glycerol-3-phosphate acyltransferase
MNQRRRFRRTLKLSAALADTLWSIGRMAIARRPEALVSPWCRRLLGRLGVEVRLESPLPVGVQLWVANHLSWLDPLVLQALRPCGALAKAEVADYPLVGPGAKRAGLRFVQREDPLSRAAALARMAADLRAGRDFLVFPEGTTTQGDTLAPLYEGSLRLAYRLGISVLALHLFSEDDHYPWIGDEELLPHVRRLCDQPSTVVRIAPSPRLHPADFATEAAWIRRIRAELHPWTAIEESA